jgi:hypothetical protein
MGSPFDFFGDISHPDSPFVTPEQSANRKILREAMTGAGFKPLNTEWWHFTLANEPHQDKYFDFRVEHPPGAGEKTAEFLSHASGGADKVIMAFPGGPGGKNAATIRAYQRAEGRGHALT